MEAIPSTTDNSGGGVPSTEPQSTPTPQETNPQVNATENPVIEQKPQEQGFNHATASRAERRAVLESFFTPPTGEPGQSPGTTPPAGTEPNPVNTESNQPELTLEQRLLQTYDVLERFKNSDGSLNIEDLAKSYVGANSKIGEQGNKMGELNRQIQELMSKTQVPGQEPQPQNQQQPNDVLEQPKVFNKDEWFDKFYADPAEALVDALGTDGVRKLFQDIIGGTVQKAIEPLAPVFEQAQFDQDKAVWEKKVSAVASQHEDFDQLRPQVAELLKGMPDAFLDLENSIEIAYLMVKGQTANTEPKTSIDDLLKNPDFLKVLASNQDIQKNVLRVYNEQISSEPKPPMIGSHIGTQTPSTPPPEIRSVKDATRAFRAHLEGGRM